MSVALSQFLIVAGEASGDIHGSGLVQALKKINPDCEFSGLGGNSMRREGVKTFFDIDRMGAVGIVELLSDLPHSVDLKSIVMHLPILMREKQK